MSCGYEECWAETIDEDYICPICMLVCRDAVGCECGKLFCEAGVKHCFSCPNCREPTKKTSENFIRKKIANLKLYCPLKCNMVIRLGEKEKHISEECANRPIPCTKCDMTTTFAKLEIHEKEECPNRPVLCDECNGETTFSNLAQHKFDSCASRLVPCPVCKKDVKFSMRMKHLEKNVANHFMALLGQHLLLQDRFNTLEMEVLALREKLALSRLPVTATIQSSTTIVRTNKVFVGGIAPETNQDDFEKYFSKFGRVTDAVVMTDRETGRPRGFGFVTFESEESAEQVVSQAVHVIVEKHVECKKAVPKEHVPFAQISATITSDDDSGPLSSSSPNYGAFAGSSRASSSTNEEMSEQDERFLQAVQEGLFKQAEPGYYYYAGQLGESDHANFCDRFTKAGGSYCCCRSTHAENYIKTQIMCKHGKNCRFGKELCGFVHLSTDVKVDIPRGDCNRGYFCSSDCPYQHHPEALKVWKKRGKGGYPRGFRLQECSFGKNCKNKATCTYYHSPKEAFCSNCSRIGHPVTECKVAKR